MILRWSRLSPHYIVVGYMTRTRIENVVVAAAAAAAAAAAVVVVVSAVVVVDDFRS